MTKFNAHSILNQDPMFKDIFGQICWGVDWSRLLNLSMSIGEPALKIDNHPNDTLEVEEGNMSTRRVVSVKGTWWLWVYLAHWRLLRRNGECVASSSLSWRKNSKALRNLDGQKLIDIRIVSKTHKTLFEFDLGYTLEVRRMSAKPGDEIWILNNRRDELFLSLRSDGTFKRSWATKNEEGQWQWHHKIVAP